MPNSSQVTTAHVLRQAPRDVTLDSWPVRESQGTAFCLLLAVMLLFVAVSAASNSPATGATFAMLLLLSQWRYLLPVRFEISAGGVKRTVLGRSRRISWSSIGKVQRQPQGILIQRDFERGLLARMNSLFLPYGKQRSELIAIFDFYLAGRAEG